MLELNIQTKHYRQLLFFFGLAARRRDDREMDISEGLRTDIANYLRQNHIAEDAIAPILEFKAFDSHDQSAIFGEDLPIGLFLNSE